MGRKSGHSHSFLGPGIVIALFSVAGIVQSKSVTSKTKSCDKSETWFRHRRQYEYNYEAVVDLGFVGTSDQRTGTHLSCKVIFMVPEDCKVVLRLTGCDLKERRISGQLELSPISQELAAQLERHEAHVQLDRGVVVDHQMTVSEDEPTFVVNIKRAIVSQLQFPILKAEEYEAPYQQHGIFGSCPLHFAFPDDSENTVFTHFDITQCQVPQVYGRQLSLFSFVKTFQPVALQSPITELIYPFKTEAHCIYDLSKRRLTKSECTSTQAFQPTTFGGELRATAMANVTQSLTLLSTKEKTFPIDIEDLPGQKTIDLMMEHEINKVPEVLSSAILGLLDNLLDTYTQPSDAMPTDKFQDLVDSLRNARESTLEEILDRLVQCRSPSSCSLSQKIGTLDPHFLQSLRESYFTDGLLSCGTDACVSVYVTCLQRELISYFETEMTLFNMAVFYHPHPSVINKIFTLCKTKNSNNCWLSLGTLLGKLAASIRATKDPTFADQGTAVAYKILQYLRVAIGDTCRPGAQQDADSESDSSLALLITLKTLGNVGSAIQDLHDDVIKNDKDLVPVLILCLKNIALPEKVSRAALVALRKTEMRKELRFALYDLLADATRPLPLRTTAFDLLLRYEDVDNARELIRLVKNENLKSLQAYMTTRINFLLETISPTTTRLRGIWREALAGVTLPVPPFFSSVRGSKYFEFARYLNLPISDLPIGSKLGLSIIYDPASIVFSSLKMEFSATFGETTFEIFQIALDVQGFENIARELLGPDLNMREQDPGVFFAKLMQAAMNKIGDPPTFFFNNKHVVKTLKNLVLRTNMPASDLLQAEFQISVFGNEIGYVYLEDLISMVKQGSRGSDKEPHRVQMFLQRFAEGLKLFVGKSLSMVEVQKVLPTIAGLPLSARVQSTMVASAMFDAVAKTFLSRTSPLEIKGSLKASVGAAVWCQNTVSIGNLHSSGLRLNISVLVNGQTGGRMKYAPVHEQPGGPGVQVIEFGLDVPKEPLNLIKIRSDLFLLQNGEEWQVENPSTQISLLKCLPPNIQRWTGRRVCVNGFHQPMTFSPDFPLWPLSGPTHLDVIASTSDSKLKEYTAIFKFKRHSKANEHGTTSVVEVSCSAPGDELKRQLDINFTFNAATKGLRLSASVPEIELLYHLDFHSTFGASGKSHMHEFSTDLSLASKTLHSLILEFNSTEEPRSILNPKTKKYMNFTQSGKSFRLKSSLPGLTLEVVADTSLGKRPGHFSHSAVMRYYCEPELGIPYALHPRPDLAAKNGHVSEYVFSNVAVMQGASLAQGWKGEDTMNILVPGHNITLQNRMAANLTFAERETIIYWITNAGTPQEYRDIINMTAAVHNYTVGHIHNYTYRMLMEHGDAYVVFLNGELHGAISNLTFRTNVTYRTKPSRQRRSLKSLFSRLETKANKVKEPLETVEGMVLKRGAQLTNAFLGWLSKEGEGQILVSQRQTQPDDGVVIPMTSAVSKLFSRPTWSLTTNAYISFKPVMKKPNATPEGFSVDWDLNISLPDVKKDLFTLNGTVERGQGWDVSSKCLMGSDFFNLSLDFFLKQHSRSQLFYHLHRWRLIDLSTHSYDRSFTILVDLQRQDHFNYSVELVSPRTNLYHVITFSTLSAKMRTIGAKMRLNMKEPPFHIQYAEHSNITSEGMVTTINLNSTWLDMDTDMNIDWSKQGVVKGRKHFDILGKVPYLNGPIKLDAEFSMGEPSPPFLLLARTTAEGVRYNILGQLFGRDTLLISRTVREPGSIENVTLFKWRLHIQEPTLMAHSVQWDPSKSKYVIGSIESFLKAGAHALKVFGETMATNVHLNIPDMKIPFINQTVSGVIDRVVKGQLKQVSMSGLDSRQNVPTMVKILKGGLRVTQAIQSAWANSSLGKFAYTIGIHNAVSMATLITTKFPYRFLNDPPFFWRQFFKFSVQPKLAIICSTGKFNYTIPLPFHMTSFLERPRIGMLMEQVMRWRYQMSTFSQARLPFVGVVSASTIQTFDGLSLGLQLPEEPSCTYLLATDLVFRKYSVLLQRNNVVVVTETGGVMLGENGTVVSTNANLALSAIPSTGADGGQMSVTMKDGLLEVTLDKHMRLTYDLLTHIGVVELAWHTHNRSLGLLGTNTREPGDELRLSTGQIAADPQIFQNSYELSRQQYCSSVAAGETPSASCPSILDSLCTKYFSNQTSFLFPCFSVIDPQPFLKLCRNHECQEAPHTTKNACSIIKSYLNLCRSRAESKLGDQNMIFIMIIRECDECSRNVPAAKDKLDLVFGFALSSRSTSSVDSKNIVSNFIGDLNIEDMRIGLVHGDDQSARANFIEGKLFASKKDLESKRIKLKNPTDSTSAGAVIHTAASYPFREDARRFIVLITDSETSKSADRISLREKLLQKGVSLIILSGSEGQSSRSGQAVAWDMEIMRKGRGGQVDFPETPAGLLAKDTQGMWADLDIVNAGKKDPISRFTKFFYRLFRQPSPLCGGKAAGNVGRLEV